MSMRREVREGFWRRKVTLFGVTMEFRFWVIGFISLTWAIIGFLIMIFFSPPMIMDLLGSTSSTVGIIVAVLAWIYGASREQVNDVLMELRNFRGESIKELQAIGSELREIRSILEKIVELLRR